MKKNLSYVGVLIILVIVLIASLTLFQGSHPPVHATTVCPNLEATCLDGWAWSSNTGWVSFNSADDPAASSTYDVAMDSSGNLSGYAWSSGVGWISFNPLVNSSDGNCPTSDTPLQSGDNGSCQARVSTTTGAVYGWARAIAGCQSDNWNGNACIGVGPGNDNGTITTGGTVGLSFSTSTMVLDGQTGTIDQDIVITNNTSITFPAVRATITNPSGTYSSQTYSGLGVPIIPYYLTANPNSGCAYQPLNPFSPYSEYGIDSHGNYFFQSNFPLKPGQSVNIHAMYYSGCRVMPTVTYLVSPANKIPEPTLPSSAVQITTGVNPTGFFTYLGLPVNVTWFTNAANTAYTYPTTYNAYAYQYSDDGGTTWHTAYGFNNGPIFNTINAASANASQVVDFGVPQTNSPVTSTRIYKIFTFPYGNYGQADLGTTTIPSSAFTSNVGWDGWIHLSGVNNPTAVNFSGGQGVTYASSTNQFLGYAWGSNVMGWLQFTPTGIGSNIVSTTTCTGAGCGVNSITATCSINPITYQIPSGHSSISVIATMSNYSGGTGPYSTTTATTFNLTAGSYPLTVSITDSAIPPKTNTVSCGTITVTGGNIVTPLICTYPNYSSYCGTSNAGQPYTGTQTAPIYNPNCANSGLFCSFQCQNGYHVNASGTSCVKSSTIEI